MSLASRVSRVTLAPPFRPPVSTSRRDEALQGGVLEGVIGVVVVPEPPDDLAPHRRPPLPQHSDPLKLNDLREK